MEEVCKEPKIKIHLFCSFTVQNNISLFIFTSKKAMKYFFFFLIVFSLIAGCKPKVLSGAALQNKLMETMGNYLDTTLKPGVHATVKDVAYYPEASKSLYNCRFHVNMQFGNKDTTGVVVGTITNDFKTVTRSQ